MSMSNLVTYFSWRYVIEWCVGTRVDLKNGHLKGMFLIDIEICIQNVCQCTSLISGGTCMIIQGNKKNITFIMNTKGMRYPYVL